MRVTNAHIRDIARVGGIGWRPPAQDQKITGPSSIRKKAVTLYHEEGHPAALAYLAGRRPGPSKGLSGVFGADGARAGEGNRLQRNFDRYVRHSVNDGREVVETWLPAEVSIGRHLVAGTADVVLFDDAGHAARLLNWDLKGVTREVALVMAVAGYLVVENQYGAGITTDVAVWDLEHERRFAFGRKELHAAVRELGRLLDRADPDTGV